MSKLSSEKRYEIAVDLYKHFNQLTFSSLGFIYTLISGLVAFYFAHSTEESINYILIICLGLSFISIIISAISVCLLNNLNDELVEIAKELQLPRYPSIRPIKYFLIGNALVFLVLLVFFIKLIM